jgi:hypothetical protein
MIDVHAQYSHVSEREARLDRHQAWRNCGKAIRSA